MQIFLLLIGGLLSSQVCNVKGEISLFLQDLFAGELNPEYVTNFEGFIHEEEEDGMFVNFTVIKQFPPETKSRFLLKGAAMGEYVVATGFDYTMDFCEMVEEPIIMGRTLQAFGFNENDCPPSPGVYGTESYVLDLTTLPDEFPANNYMLFFDILDEDNEIIMSIHVQLRVF